MPVAGNEGFAMLAASGADHENHQQPKGNMFNFEIQLVLYNASAGEDIFKIRQFDSKNRWHPASRNGENNSAGATGR